MEDKNWSYKSGNKVIACYTRRNDKPLKPTISIDLDCFDDDPSWGTWLNLREAEGLVKQLQKAITKIREREAKKSK